MKKKILFIIPLPPPIHGASIINKCIKNSTKINKKFETFYINSHTSKTFESLEKFNFYKIAQILKVLCLCFFKLLFKNPDIVFFNLSPLGWGLYKDCVLVFLIRLFKKKIIYHMHGKGIKNQVIKSNFKKILFRYLLKNANLICLSKKLVNDINIVRDKSKLLTIINNFSEKSNIKNKKISKSLTFVYLSNLIVSKGILIFLDAIKILQNKKKIKSFEVKIIGKATDERFHTLIKNKTLSLQNINYLGPLYGSKKFIELNKSDILVFPTMYSKETYPLAILESMQMKLGIISTNEGAISEIIDHNQNGFILKRCNAHECAHYMLKYIRNMKLAYAHGTKAKLKYSKRYTFKIFEKNICNFLERI